MIARQLNRSILLVLGTLLISFFSLRFTHGQTGEPLFKTYCASCHTVGGGRLVGPDLKGVHDRRDAKWISAFIKSPQAVIESGDVYAVALYEQYGKLQMPTMPLSDNQIAEVTDYLKTASGGGSVAAGTVSTEAATATTEAQEPTMEEIEAGQDMFQGKIRLANGGAACNSCHNVKNDAVIGGGILAKELTSVFSSIGGGGVTAILGQPPFAVMNAAYKDKPLLKNEITSLVAFLQHADSQQAYHEPKDYGVGLFVSGLVGAVLLLLLYQLRWWNRKTKSVNQEIYDRQVKSTTDW